MSEKNVEIIESLQRGFDAYSRCDFETAVENFHPEIELVPAGRQPMIRGVAAVRTWMEPDASSPKWWNPWSFASLGTRSWSGTAPRSVEPGAASRLIS
jgi:hypothetical protein